MYKKTMRQNFQIYLERKKRERERYFEASKYVYRDNTFHRNK